MKAKGVASLLALALLLFWPKPKKKKPGPFLAVEEDEKTPNAPGPGEELVNVPRVRPVTPRGPAKLPPAPIEEPSPDFIELQRKLNEQQQGAEDAGGAGAVAKEVAKGNKKKSAPKPLSGFFAKNPSPKKMAPLQMGDWVRLLVKGDTPRFVSVRVYGVQETSPLRTYWGTVESSDDPKLLEKQVKFTVAEVYGLPTRVTR